MTRSGEGIVPSEEAMQSMYRVRKDEGTLMDGVTEYGDGYPVRLVETTGGRLAIKAWNEGGYNWTEVDLLEVLAWVKANRPDLI